MMSSAYRFTTEDTQKLFNGKFVVVIGDSVMRAMYKDLLILFQENRILTDSEMKKRGEGTFLGDELIEGGEKGEMTNSKDYCEVRQFCRPNFLLRFYFVTRVYSSYVETVLADLVSGPTPHVILMNSCLWDISRYGPQSMREFKQSLQLLRHDVKRLLPSETLFMWTTCLPVSQDVRGGFLIEPVKFMNEVLRIDVLLANFYCSQVVSDHGFDVVDLHHAFRRATQHRASDGVHWDGFAHREVTQLLLQHICEAWHIEVPVPKLLSITTSLNVIQLPKAVSMATVQLPGRVCVSRSNVKRPNFKTPGALLHMPQPSLRGEYPSKASTAGPGWNRSRGVGPVHSRSTMGARRLPVRERRGSYLRGSPQGSILGQPPTGSRCNKGRLNSFSEIAQYFDNQANCDARRFGQNITNAGKVQWYGDWAYNVMGSAADRNNFYDEDFTRDMECTFQSFGQYEPSGSGIYGYTSFS